MQQRLEASKAVLRPVNISVVYNGLKDLDSGLRYSKVESTSHEKTL
jgi:hypothetical protein